MRRPVGWRVPAARRGAPEPTDSALLEVAGLEMPGFDEAVSLSVRAGEIVGITGLEGAGFREFLLAAMGINERSAGSISIVGKPAPERRINLRALGCVYIPSDRARTSGIPSATAYENMTLGQIGDYCRYGLIRRQRERRTVRDMLERLEVNPPHPERLLEAMSGGQQQKVVVGRALLSKARLLVLEEPVAGVDVGARDDILAYLRAVAEQGRGVIVASSEFEWMSSLCDRVVVFAGGRIAGELSGLEIEEERILSLAYSK